MSSGHQTNPATRKYHTIAKRQSIDSMINWTRYLLLYGSRKISTPFAQKLTKFNWHNKQNKYGLVSCKSNRVAELEGEKNVDKAARFSIHLGAIYQLDLIANTSHIFPLFSAQYSGLRPNFPIQGHVFPLPWTAIVSAYVFIRRKVKENE